MEEEGRAIWERGGQKKKQDEQRCKNKPAKITVDPSLHWQHRSWILEDLGRLPGMSFVGAWKENPCHFPHLIRPCLHGNNSHWERRESSEFVYAAHQIDFKPPNEVSFPTRPTCAARSSFLLSLCPSHSLPAHKTPSITGCDHMCVSTPNNRQGSSASVNDSNRDKDLMGVMVILLLLHINRALSITSST